MYCTKNDRSGIWKLWGFRGRVKVGKCHLHCDRNDIHILLNCSETEKWRQLNQKWPSNNEEEANNKFVRCSKTSELMQL
jgi:hypothetical protein